VGLGKRARKTNLNLQRYEVRKSGREAIQNLVEVIKSKVPGRRKGKMGIKWILTRRELPSRSSCSTEGRSWARIKYVLSGTSEGGEVNFKKKLPIRRNWCCRESRGESGLHLGVYDGFRKGVGWNGVGQANR